MTESIDKKLLSILVCPVSKAPLEYDREKAPYFSSLNQQDDYWRKRVKYDVLNLKLAGKEAGGLHAGSCWRWLTVPPGGSF